jgi:hypothetical protein
LNLYTICHPHTGVIISQKFDECLAEWNIEPRKVILIITDNGSNMIRTVNVLNEALATEQEQQYGEDCGDLASSESEDDEDNQTRGAHGEEHDHTKGNMYL